LGTSSGGNVTGTVRTLLRTPAWPAVTQNDVPPRVENTFGRAIGIQSKRNFGGWRRTMPRSGRYVA
jgi:hypothetical protein